MKVTNRPKVKTEWATCEVCDQKIYRDTYKGNPPGSWWHDFPGQDFKHIPAPMPAKGVIAFIKHLLNR